MSDKMVVQVEDILAAIPESEVYGTNLFVYGSKVPVTFLSHVNDNLDWDAVDEAGGSVWVADGWAERVTPS